MNTQKCGRCNRDEYIPTHQFIKLDNEMYELCSSCFRDANTFLYSSGFDEEGIFRRPRIEERPKTKSDLGGMLKTGRDFEPKPITKPAYDLFISWLNVGEISRLGKLVRRY